MLLGTPAAGYIACAAAVRDMDLRHLLGKIVAPTLVIGGTRDPATTLEHARYLRDHIRGARLIELEAAHISNLEAGARFDAAVVDFLGRSASP
jgi:3-oxoadipate enol-lactonase